MLEDGIGFLSPLDCASFDLSMHEYLNADYFNCPSSGVEIVKRLAALRETREAELYMRILTAVYQTLESLFKRRDDMYGPAVLTKTSRPWGRNGEPVKCWALSLHALLRRDPESAIYPTGRPSVFSLIEGAMPEMVFPFTVDLLKDALRLFVTPYGQIADTEPFKFPQCDCIDERHQLPCEKSAVVLCIAVYTKEEAVRRDAEEILIFDIFQVSKKWDAYSDTD